MTNADKIRGMTDEELKKFLIKFSDANECDYCGFYKFEICTEECEDGLLLWLQQEHKERDSDGRDV